MASLNSSGTCPTTKNPVFEQDQAWLEHSQALLNQTTLGHGHLLPQELAHRVNAVIVRLVDGRRWALWQIDHTLASDMDWGKYISRN